MGSGQNAFDEFCSVRVNVSRPAVDLRARARVRHRVQSGRCTRRYFLSRSREEGLAKEALVSAVGRERLRSGTIPH